MTRTLVKAIRLHHATALVVGTIIGASIFVQPSEITGRVPSLGGTALVWICAGLLTYLGALVCAELASALPRTGGVYVFLREAFSPAVGFLWGWAMFWTMHSGIIAAIAVIFARYLGYFLPLGDVGLRVAAVAAIAVLSAVNYLGVRRGSDLQAIFTAGKILAVAVILVLGFALGGDAAAAAAAAPSPAVGGASAKDFLLALVAGLFAFGGWHMVTYNADETVDAERTIPRALTLGVWIVTACYVGLNAVYFHVLPLETVMGSERVAADAADAVLGFGGGAAMSGLVAFSTFGALSGIVLAGPRVYWAMAEDGLVFRWLGEVHATYRTPHRAIALQGLWASVLVLTGTYRALFTRVVYTEWIFFGLLGIAVLVLRRRPGYAPVYRVWGGPVLPLIFALAAFAVVVNQVVAEPIESLVGLSMVAVGLPVYLIWCRRTNPTEETP
ncbi:MAG TPA: amino acid permease [Longimicrobiales bacterium]|jgi:APA family basic amino acid/polyamine antiporter